MFETNTEIKLQEAFIRARKARSAAFIGVLRAIFGRQSTPAPVLQRA